jgi:hypothetical protein
MKRNIFRGLFAAVAGVLVLVGTCMAQNPQACSNDCTDTWIPGTGGTIVINCGGCSQTVTYSYWYRTNCAEPEVLVDKYTFALGSCVCSTDLVVAEVFKDIVRHPPPGFRIPSRGDGCVNYWRFNMSNCWGERIPVQGWNEFLACNNACCWARFQICRDADNQPAVMTRQPGANGNVNLPVCEDRSHFNYVQICDPICSTMWNDRFPEGLPVSVGQ